MRLMESHPEWALGFEDEVWWSRFAMPNMHAWAYGDKPLRLVEQCMPKDDPDPKALACYGLLMRWTTDQGQPHEEAWLRFVEGRPVSGLTTAFLEWSCQKLQTLGKKALLLVWDNASWHISAQVREWLSQHNQRVKLDGKGVRILECVSWSAGFLPGVPGSIPLNPSGFMENARWSRPMASSLPRRWPNEYVMSLDVAMKIIWLFPKWSPDYALGSRAKNGGNNSCWIRRCTPWCCRWFLGSRVY